MSGGAVALRAVTKRFGALTAVDDVTLEVDAGEFLAILGPSGSGKTTTMRLIGGFEQPDAGSVAIAGADVTGVPAFRRDVHTVFQNYGLFPHMSVVDNVAYGLRMKRVRRRERRAQARDALALVQLEGVADRRPGELSGGMQQRVALARALVDRPSVLLLDEPLGALDRKLREGMQLELRQLHEAVETTFVYVTHDQEEALSMSDRLVVMRDGAIEQVGAPGAVYDAPVSLWVAGFVGSSNEIPAVVRTLGAPVALDSDIAPLLAGPIHGTVGAGDRAVAVVRPERVSVAPATEHDEPAANHVGARLEELLTVGADVKAVAVTAGGLRFTARVPRATGGGVGDARPGDPVRLSFAAEDLHLYPAPDTTKEPR